MLRWVCLYVDRKVKYQGRGVKFVGMVLSFVHSCCKEAICAVLCPRPCMPQTPCMPQYAFSLMLWTVRLCCLLRKVVTHCPNNLLPSIIPSITLVGSPYLAHLPDFDSCSCSRSIRQPSRERFHCRAQVSSRSCRCDGRFLSPMWTR